jgi:hypothetical protein
VLKHCLAEVISCRPFIIVLLGDRYGWAPLADRIESTARYLGQFWPHMALSRARTAPEDL